MVRFASWNGQRKARLGAVRRTPANKPGRRELVRVARREAPSCFREGTRADKEQMVASLGAPSPSLCRGVRKRDGRQACPGPRQRIRVMTHVSYASRQAGARCCLTSELEKWCTTVQHIPLIPVPAFAGTGSSGDQRWMPACAGTSGCCEAVPTPGRHRRAKARRPFGRHARLYAGHPRLAGDGRSRGWPGRSPAMTDESLYANVQHSPLIPVPAFAGTGSSGDPVVDARLRGHKRRGTSTRQAWRARSIQWTSTYRTSWRR